MFLDVLIHFVLRYIFISCTVTISGGNFKGFLIQARKGSDTKPLGTWSLIPTGTHLQTCTKTDDSVTHDSSKEKTSVTLTWTATESYEEIRFV